MVSLSPRAAFKSTIAIMEDSFIRAHPFMEESGDAEGGSGEDSDSDSDSDDNLSVDTSNASVSSRAGESSDAEDAGLDDAAKAAKRAEKRKARKKEERAKLAASEPTYRLPPRIRAILAALNDVDASKTFGKHRLPQQYHVAIAPLVAR